MRYNTEIRMVTSKKTADVLQSSVVSADGTLIAYRERGSGPGVVLIHGALQAAQNFSRLAAKLSTSFRVYVPDRRGRGRSGPFGAEYGLAREAEDLDALLRKTGARFVFGLSSGALIALYGARNIQGIEKLAVYEPPLTFEGADPAGWVPRYRREIDPGNLAAAMVTAIQGTGDVEVLTYFAALPPRAVDESRDPRRSGQGRTGPRHDSRSHPDGSIRRAAAT
jgi:pimeloyl-ACP methyl ester carboxylesterase